MVKFIILIIILAILMILMTLLSLAYSQEVTREENKILQWHLSESQAQETEGLQCNPVEDMDICVRVRKAETSYWIDQKTFPDTYVGSKRGRRFYFYNRGTKDLICNKPILSGAFTSSFAADKRAVTPGNRLSFIVYFTPPSVGDHYTIMKFVCNDYEKPQEFILTGKGKLPL